MLTHINQGGEILWRNKVTHIFMASTHRLWGTRLIQSYNDNYLFFVSMGETSGNSSGENEDISIFKFNTHGIIQVIDTLEFQWNGLLQSVFQLSSEDIVAAGWHSNTLTLSKVTKDGAVLEMKEFDSISKPSYAKALPDGTFYVTAHGHWRTLEILKFDQNFNLLWQQSYYDTLSRSGSLSDQKYFSLY